MGKKIELKKIKDCKKSQVTFSKRRSNIIKKVQEISISCDIDVAFIAFSSAGRISKYCNLQRIEDLLDRYADLPVEKRLSHIDNIQEKVKRLQELGNISSEEGYFACLNDQIEKLQLKVKAYEVEVERTEAALREFEIRSEEEATLQQLSRCEANLKQAIEKVKEIKLEKLAMEMEMEMEKGKGKQWLLNEDGNSNLLHAECGSSNGQHHLPQCLMSKEYIYPNNLFDEMLGKDFSKGKTKVFPASVASDQNQMTALQVAESNSFWIGDINLKKENLVTRDLLSAFTEKSNGVRKTSSGDDDDDDDADVSNYLEDMSVTKNGSNPGDDIIKQNANNNVNINKDREVMILSPPPPPSSSSATDFFSFK